MKSELLGLVLCGGKSSRMGTDKGLIPAGDKTWATVVAGKLQDLKIPYYISISEAQYDAYSRVFAPELLIKDNSMVPGPLKGVLSAHNIHPQHDLLIIACDLIDIKPSSLHYVIDQYRTNAGYDFYCYHHDGFFEPFGGIYTASGLKKVVQRINDEKLENFSFQNILNTGHTRKLISVDITDFANYNARN